MRKFVRFAVSFLSLIALPLAAEAPVAPGFVLVTGAGEPVEMKAGDGALKVIVFTSAGCREARAAELRLIGLVNRFAHQGIRFYVIDTPSSGNDAEPRAESEVYPHAFLQDRDGAVAASYDVAVTPTALVVDGSGRVVYRGAIEDVAASGQPPRAALVNALGALMGGREVGVAETHAVGCAVPRAKRVRP